MSFLNKESHRVLFLILFSLLKKIKRSGDFKSFSKNQIFTNRWKTSLTIRVGMHMQNAGSTKWWLHWECLKGQTWTQVEGNVAFDWSIDGYLAFVLVYAWVIIAHWGFWCGDFIYLIALSICDIDMVMILIDSPTCLSILILLLPWLSCLLWHVCSHCCISCLSYCWLSCLYINLIIFEHTMFVAIHLDCCVLV